jgi:ergothioneine biosynthesis protein EgtB
LSAEDQMVQSCPEASPAKWHQAHTTWFLETFVLRPFLAGYQPFREEFYRLFGSDSLSPDEGNSEKKLRGSFSRPSLEEVLAFRAHVDQAMDGLLRRAVDGEAIRRVVLGVSHEEQHQERLLADIKHAFFSNPLRPAYKEAAPGSEGGRGAANLSWHSAEAEVAEIGHSPNAEDPLDFCFDNETPRHRVFLESFQMASREATCREYLEFMADDAYMRPELWLPEGWNAVAEGDWEAPLYWEHDAGDPTGWRVFTLCGWHGLSALLDTPVCHVSFFEAEAFARWRGCRLPTEAEWEWMACRKPPSGNLLETERLHPATAEAENLCQFFGDCWEWTSSAYMGYPGYKPLPGAVGESKGKFMPGQMILRGGSCVTPADHVRATYRNFFPPATRWQFTGIRLAA